MAKRRLKKKIRGFIILIILACGLYFAGPFIYNKFIKSGDSKKVIAKLKPEKKEKVYTLNLIAGGDALIHKPVRYSALDDATGTFDFTPEFALIKDIIGEYDLKYYNQESMINGSTDYLDSTTALYFNTPTAFGDATIDYAGFNLVSLANNHSMDTGASGAYGTIDYWNSKKEKNGIMFAGMNNSEEMKNDYSKNIGTINNITYGFLSYTTSINGNALPEAF